MQFPERPAQHISETASYKIFSSAVPDRWIVRDVSERDYGVDCYIEIVDEKQQLTGQLISIQLKSRATIEWNKTEPTRWTLSGVEMPTTNYWYHFAVPVFICVVDVATREVFFQSVNQAIKLDYQRYAENKSFSYKIDKGNLLSDSQGIGKLLKQYYRDKNRTDFEVHVISFLANYQSYIDFYEQNTGRDIFLGVETTRVLFARQFYNNIQFLSNYLGLPWALQPFADYEQQAREAFGDNYDLYEMQLSAMLDALHSQLLPVLAQLKELITGDEFQYWIKVDDKLLNHISNADEEGNFADW